MKYSPTPIACGPNAVSGNAASFWPGASSTDFGRGEIWALSQILHDWPDTDFRAILQSCRAVMRDTDRLLVIEMLTVPCDPNLPVSQIDMVMLMYFGEARQRTIDEYRQLFTSTRFALARALPTASAFSIVQARPV